MKKTLTFTTLSLLVSFFAGAQQTKPPLDSASRRTALAVCNCLSKQDLTKVDDEAGMQQVFLKCLVDSAGEVFTEVLQKADTKAAGEEMGKKIAMDLFSVGCSPFMTLAMKAAGAKDQKKTALVEDAKVMEGTIINVEEKDFLYVNIKNKANREFRFIYLAYVPGSDAWIKNASSLSGKKVRVEWQESEVYQPKAKVFTQLKQIKKLTVL